MSIARVKHKYDNKRRNKKGSDRRSEFIENVELEKPSFEITLRLVLLTVSYSDLLSSTSLKLTFPVSLFHFQPKKGIFLVTLNFDL